MTFVRKPFVLNTGVSFGYGSFSLFQISVLFIAFFVWGEYVWRSLSRVEMIAISSIRSGAIGNIISRFLYGGVRDYFSLFGIVFNIYDLVIVVGLFYFIYMSVLSFCNRSNRGY